MPLRERAKGTITSLQLGRAVVALANENAERCQAGQKATAQINPPNIISGKVLKPLQAQGKTNECEIEFSDPLPVSVPIGASVGALIDVGEMRNVVFLARPADSSPNSEAAIFVLEPGSQFARRVTVHYGKISGALIQVIDGLSPGDRVIVTDMSKWLKYQRIRIQ